MRTIPLIVLGLSALCAFTACDNKDDKTGTDAPTTGGSVACYSAVQFNCDEWPMPTTARDEQTAVACSSGSGDLTRPAACPAVNFQGKCTSGSGADTHVERYYPGADVAYAEDFCVNTAHGVWSTTF